MSIAYRDFHGKVISSGIFSKDKFDDIDSAVAQANSWIALNSVRVLNVETVIGSFDTKSGSILSQETCARESSEVSNYTFQVIRVWYHS